MEVRPNLDPEHRAVLADWLGARGDPRGELLNLELALELAPAEHRRVLAERLASLRAELEPRWVAALAAQLSLTPAQLHAFLPGRWYAGLLLECGLCPTAELALSGVATVLLEWVLDSEAAVALEVLHAGELAAGPVVEQLATRAAMPRLRRLVLGDYREPIGALAPLDGQLPALRELELRGPGAELAGFEAPLLERLSLQCRGDWTTPLASFAACPWPALERLELRFDGREHERGARVEIELEQLAPLLDGDATPALRELELSSFTCDVALVRALARSPMLARLGSLALVEIKLDYEAADAMIEHGSAFDRLARFDLRPFDPDPDGSGWVPHTLVERFARLNLC